MDRTGIYIACNIAG